MPRPHPSRRLRAAAHAVSAGCTSGRRARVRAERLLRPCARASAANAVTWLFDKRAIKATGSDTFGPDASSDEDFSATSITLAKGGITVENVGPGLAKMRPFGDWVSINGARPRFSGFQMGITGFTKP